MAMAINRTLLHSHLAITIYRIDPDREVVFTSQVALTFKGDYFIPFLPLPSMALTLTLTLDRLILLSQNMYNSHYP